MSDGHKAEIEPAKEGDFFSLDGRAFVVARKCDRNAGTWICTLHAKAFGSNFDKDMHLDLGGRHIMAWKCDEHGPEVP